MKGEPEGIREKREDESYVEYYLSESTNDYSDLTEAGYRSAWNNLESWADEQGYNLDEIDNEKAEEFADFLEENIKENVAGRYLNSVSTIVDWLIIEADEADYNPYKPYLNRFDTGSNSEKIEVKLPRLRQAVQDARQYRIELFVYLVLLLKTGLRAAEALNLDLRDIHLDHPIADVMPTPRKEILNYPDSLYVDSSISKGKVHNGEERRFSNKPHSSRTIPIDQELKNVLVWWIGMLPPTTSPAKPLISKVSSIEASRPSKAIVQVWVTKWAREHDLNAPDQKHYGVDSHWCRHWFTTMLRANINPDEVVLGSPKEYVEGLRGDSPDGVIETYTQRWEELRDEDDKAYREVYEDNIPLLLVDPKSGQ